MTRRITHFRSLSLATCLVLVAGTGSAFAQQRVITTSDGKTIVVNQDGAFSPAQATPSATPAPVVKPDSESDPAKKEDDKAKADGESKKEKEKDGEKKKDDDTPKVVKRPMKSDEPASPIASQVGIDKANMVTFDLKGQPWEQVLEWLADASKLSLDWQELPGDYLNLTTTRAYSLEEARDIINRHLLARGYTIVLNGELMSVLKISEVKSSLVPRVKPDDLETLPDHTLCKVSFDLNWLIADEAVEELAPLLTSAGKISKLSRTNRLEVIDTAKSLREIHRILQDEQSDQGQEQLVKTFRLKHRRATEVIVLLRTLLGLENEVAGGGSMSSSGTAQIQSMMRQMQQQLQRISSSGAKKGGGGSKEPVKTRLVLNPRENMILVQAAPDQMAIIDKAIQQIDVAVEASNSLLQNMNKFKIYRRQTVDPQTLVDLLQELGDMSPGTVLNVDKEKKAILAFANLADHLTITTLVDRLDQSGRVVEVIHLRRLDAEYVAGTIRALMAPPKEDNNSRSGYFSRFSYNQPKKNDEREFKVEADIENNRLLVYANQIEMGEINLLLQKLGEIPDPDGYDNGMRVFELSPNDDPHQVLDRLKRLWNGKNKLEIDLPEKTDSETPDAKSPAADRTESVTQAPATRRVQVWRPEQKTSEFANSSRVEQTQLSADEFFAHVKNSIPDQQETAQNSPESQSKAWPRLRQTSKPADRQAYLTTAEDKPKLEDVGETTASEEVAEPIRFSLSPDGRLVVTSNDRAALRAVEDLMRELVRPTSSYRVFYLKYATPSWVTINLEDYFKSEQDSGPGYGFDPYWGSFYSTRGNGSSDKASLGKRRQPRFIYDNFTSTILVRNADRRQMSIIEDLIDIYDIPEPADTRAMRITKIFKLQNSQAGVVAQAVKDVFRDLLSANDKALEKKDGEKTQTRVYSYFGDDSDDDESPIRFKGLLSIGVDETSNTLVVSSTSALMDTVGELIEELDKAAQKSSAVRVLKVDPTVDIQLIQERLNKALGTSKNATPKKKGQQGPNGQNPNGQPLPGNAVRADR